MLAQKLALWNACTRTINCYSNWSTNIWFDCSMKLAIQQYNIFRNICAINNVRLCVLLCFLYSKFSAAFQCLSERATCPWGAFKLYETCCCWCMCARELVYGVIINRMTLFFFFFWMAKQIGEWHERSCVCVYVCVCVCMCDCLKV